MTYEEFSHKLWPKNSSFSVLIFESLVSGSDGLAFGS